MADEDGRGEPELFDGGFDVVDVGLTGVLPLGGLGALAVAALVEGDGAEGAEGLLGASTGERPAITRTGRWLERKPMAVTRTTWLPSARPAKRKRPS